MNDELHVLKERMAKLERDVSAIKSRGVEDARQPWWQRISGRFAGDPAFEEIVRLGREFREAQRPEDE